jgi:hypothetical protein
MNIQRFEQLVEAYGADPKRWPEGEREAARALAHAQAEHCGPLLEAAHALDQALDCAPAGAPSIALRERVIGAAPRQRAPRFGLGQGVKGSGGPSWLWWPSAGLAAACAAGVLFGVVVTDHATRAARADTVLAANAELSLNEAADPMETL